ncbi:hypothetical protein H4CHR_03237 [Variovorax sp. PBS-H4]|uniref:SCO family protein n=1 Tax=Variovorax sp. PBS-H4 TaxID=434008 RepID=UPI001319A748|nr:SCO family protein [Variovorax sp. PBS-H4]VTU33551.1 hypothetical protein H4CHR_03237 [Variovorax sp. PBS-H4]
MKRHLVLAVAAALWIACHTQAQPLVTPVPPSASITQQLDVALPMDMTLVDSRGRRVHLRDYFGDGRAVLLVLGYYRCPQLCGLVMQGLLQALHDAQVPRREMRILRVSIDPGDTPATATARRELDLAYADFLLGAQPADGALELEALTALAADSARLARQAGVSYTPLAPDPSDRSAALPSRYAHPAAVLVMTPQGRISRYFMGIAFDASELRLALAEASRGRIGGLSERLALLCAHFDPHWGRHSDAVMNGLRAMGILLAGALGAWCWRRRGAPPGRRP